MVVAPNSHLQISLLLLLPVPVVVANLLGPIFADMMDLFWCR